tara:strand:+ start:254 stop:490 length:237 start_codon:yes stop_codon:yes gene_type:complete
MLSDGANSDSSEVMLMPVSNMIRMEKIMSVGWLGQTIASMCWILSVFAYGISTTGDWLQLLAASSWMVSNIAGIFSLK